MRAAVLSCGNPHLYREVWDEAPGYDDIMRFWEGPVAMAQALESQHFIKIRCAGRHQFDDAGERLGKPCWRRFPVFSKTKTSSPWARLASTPRSISPSPGRWKSRPRVSKPRRSLRKNTTSPSSCIRRRPKKSQDFLGNVAVQADVPPEQIRLHYMQKDLEIIRKDRFR